jgi:GAF domain-containing protein
MTAPEDSSVRAPAPTGDLADVMSRTARRLQEEHGDIEATLNAVTAAAVQVVPGAEQCGITYVIGRRLEPRAWTGDLPHQIDALQQRLAQGPCMDAVREHEVVRVDDIATDERWPDFGPQAADLGVGSMLCFQLFVVADHLGAMNLYSSRPGAFDAESEDIGRMLAAHAAIAVAGAEHEENLRTAVGSRDVIGQAKGILMERHKLTADQAFGVLARASQELNRKLVDVAREVSATGTVPAGGHSRD